MLWAAARFQFLFNTRCLAETAAFINLTFGIKISPKTIGRHLKHRCGFRLGDFRQFPEERNSIRSVELRFEYERDMQEKYGPNTLYHAIYFDEMSMSRPTKRKAWSICGWIPYVAGETHKEGHEHISLLLSASPELGVVYYEIVEGSVTAQTVLAFCKAMVRVYVEKFEPVHPDQSRSHQRRAFIMDNVRSHHSSALKIFFEGDTMSKLIALEFLPSYSPFLNPVEEVFSLVKGRIARKRASSSETDESKAFMKQNLVEEILKVSDDDIKSFFFHVIEFLKMAKHKQPVFTQQMYENSHVGDDASYCPLLPHNVELLLNSYLPRTYDEFTPEMNRVVEDTYKCRRLTAELINGLIQVNDLSTLNNRQA